MSKASFRFWWVWGLIPSALLLGVFEGPPAVYRSEPPGSPPTLFIALPRGEYLRGIATSDCGEVYLARCSSSGGGWKGAASVVSRSPSCHSGNEQNASGSTRRD